MLTISLSNSTASNWKMLKNVFSDIKYYTPTVYLYSGYDLVLGTVC
jgi:hypothetical protein